MPWLICDGMPLIQVAPLVDNMCCKKVRSYIARYPVRRTAQGALHSCDFKFYLCI